MGTTVSAGGSGISTRADILEEARSITQGDRQDDYGTPENNFAFIAALWDAYDLHKYTARGELVVTTPFDVALKMVLLKVARAAHKPDKRDNAVDGAAYFAIAGELGALKRD